jgi:hypothetical protein
MKFKPPSRIALESQWLGRVQQARELYESISASSDGVKDLDNPAFEGALAVRTARISKAAALNEYARVLRIFTDLIVYDRIPEEEATVPSDPRFIERAR